MPIQDRRATTALIATLAATAAGCATGVNYRDATGPRYAGGQPTPTTNSTCLKLVSFNIEWADSIDAAIRLIQTNDALKEPDLLFLQEMDAPATERIAATLRRAYVYYPAIRRTKTGEDFGSAILSRWPIEEDEKLILPHGAIFGGNQRIATAATITIDGMPVRLYSAHLGTPINLASQERGDQLKAILADAEPYQRVIIAGDMNDEHVGEWARSRGYLWPTRGLPKTTFFGPIPFGAWDHVFLKGFNDLPDGAGVVTPPGPISDHKPIWATACFADTSARPGS